METHDLLPEKLLKSYIDCRKNKRNTISSLEFEMNEIENLYKLQKELINRTYEVGDSVAFCVDVPVKREIFAGMYRDRILHHLVINELKPVFELSFIHNTFSCREGKGVLYGIEQCESQLKEITENYTKNATIIKGDLKGFFMNIKKSRLYNNVESLINTLYCGDLDPEFLKWLVQKIIFDVPQKHCVLRQSLSHWKGLPPDKSLFNKDDNTGIPIGNLTSQWFANYYLNNFDHWVIEELGLVYYGRYVDDFYIIIPEDYPLSPNEILKRIKEKLLEYEVVLHPKKLYIQSAQRGLSFIGAIIKPNRKYIGQRSKGNLYKKIEKFNSSLKYLEENDLEPTKEDLKYVLACINSYLGMSIHYNSYKRRRNLMCKFMLGGWNKYFRVNDRNILKIVEKNKKH